MKKLFLAMTLSTLVCASGQAMADDCKVSLCMWGYLNGKNDGTCRSSIQEYFDIFVYKKKGKIDWGRTASKRLSKLKSCPDADSEHMDKVNNKFGRAFG